MSSTACYQNEVPLCLTQGDTCVVELTFVDDNGDLVDTTGWTALSQIRSEDADNGVVLAEFAVTYGFGQMILRIEGSDTDEMGVTRVGGEYLWDVKVDDGTNTSTPAGGPVTVKGTASRVDI